MDKYNALLKKFQECQRENKRKDRLLEEMGAKLAKTERELAEEVFRRRMGKVATSVFGSAKKKVYLAVHDLYRDGERRADGFVLMRRKEIARLSGIDVDTVSYHLKDMEKQTLLARAHDPTGQGDDRRDDLYLKPDYRIEANPSFIEKLLKPRVRAPRLEKIVEDPRCPHCGAADVNRHLIGICYTCGKDWIEYLDEPPQRKEEEEEEETIPQIAATMKIPAPDPVRPPIDCYFCHTAKHWFYSQEEKEWMCLKCLSPLAWSQHNYSLKTFPSASD